MFRNFKHISRNMGAASMLNLILGILLAVWPGRFIAISCYVIGALMIAYCVITIIGEISKKNKNTIVIMVSVLLGAIGIVIISSPQLVSSIIPVTFGIILLLDGVINIRHAVGMKRYKESTWFAMLIIGAITLALGVIVLINPYGTAQLAFRLLGAALIFSGLSDFFILHHIGRAAKKYVDSDGIHDVIDVDTRPVDEDDE